MDFCESFYCVWITKFHRWLTNEHAPSYGVKHDEGVWSLLVKRPVENFQFLPKFNTTCFIIRFQWQMALQKQQIAT